MPRSMMWDLLPTLVNLGIPLGLFGLGWWIGGRRERAHLADLSKREAAYGGLLVTDLRSYIDPDATTTPMLVTAEVVIGADYAKTLFANLKTLIGGQLGSYERMLERGRREAVMRLRERARARGCDALCNVRMENMPIGKGQMPMVAILASATAYRRRIP